MNTFFPFISLLSMNSLFQTTHCSIYLDAAVDVGIELVVASFDTISEVNMVSCIKSINQSSSLNLSFCQYRLPWQTLNQIEQSGTLKRKRFQLRRLQCNFYLVQMLNMGFGYFHIGKEQNISDFILLLANLKHFLTMHMLCISKFPSLPDPIFQLLSL